MASYPTAAAARLWRLWRNNGSCVWLHPERPNHV
jgi:hypothetical protein